MMGRRPAGRRSKSSWQRDRGEDGGGGGGGHHSTTRVVNRSRHHSPQHHSPQNHSTTRRVVNRSQHHSPRTAETVLAARPRQVRLSPLWGGEDSRSYAVIAPGEQRAYAIKTTEGKYSSGIFATRAVRAGELLWDFAAATVQLLPEDTARRMCSRLGMGDAAGNTMLQVVQFPARYAMGKDTHAGLAYLTGRRLSIVRNARRFWIARTGWAATKRAARC